MLPALAEVGALPRAVPETRTHISLHPHSPLIAPGAARIQVKASPTCPTAPDPSLPTHTLLLRFGPLFQTTAVLILTDRQPPCQKSALRASSAPASHPSRSLAGASTPVRTRVHREPEFTPRPVPALLVSYPGHQPGLPGPLLWGPTESLHCPLPGNHHLG